MKTFVLMSSDEEDLYWSAEQGWTSLDKATKFTEDEMNRSHNLPKGGQWQELPKNKWHDTDHLAVAVQHHAESLLDAIMRRDFNLTEKELADFAVISELFGVTGEVLESRRSRFAETKDLPAYTRKDMKPWKNTIDRVRLAICQQHISYRKDNPAYSTGHINMGDFMAMVSGGDKEAAITCLQVEYMEGAISALEWVLGRVSMIAHVNVDASLFGDDAK
jgi:hypothetical protein